MSEMVERVAIAISGAPFASEASRRKARAAIAAMREPTEAMVALGIAQAGECNDDAPLAACTAEHVWAAMVDEALR